MRTPTIRCEQPGDIETISRITEEAFRSHPLSNRTEQFIILALRKAKALTLSLVAEGEGKLIDHVAFSPVQISDGSPQWYGLGPISVLPDQQRQGIGTALIVRGLDQLRAAGAAGCVVLGDPRYYGRFGFQSRPDCTLADVPASYFMTLPFGSVPAVGVVTYHSAFSAQAPDR